MARFVMFTNMSIHPQPFLVRIDDEKQWADTLRYFRDCNIQFMVDEVGISVSDLSDTIAPRDD